jgi:hypothetical protein
MEAEGAPFFVKKELKRPLYYSNRMIFITFAMRNKKEIP